MRVNILKILNGFTLFKLSLIRGGECDIYIYVFLLYFSCVVKPMERNMSFISTPPGYIRLHNCSCCGLKIILI